ncbi:MAG: gluconeogenesis factor YvcK family protein, partial [Patescibacteria group bacterium]
MSKEILTVGGGSGQYVLLSGVRDVPDFNVTAVVSMADSGGSTGRLRDELGVLPPGDILKCVLALSPHREAGRSILQKRFKNNAKLAEHSVGNMLLTMLSQYCNDFSQGVEALADVLETKGRVLPVSTDRATLVAELTDGSWLFGESAIDVPRGDQKEKIKRTFLVPHHSDSI